MMVAGTEDGSIKETTEGIDGVASGGPAVSWMPVGALAAASVVSVISITDTRDINDTYSDTGWFANHHRAIISVFEAVGETLVDGEDFVFWSEISGVFVHLDYWVVLEFMDGFFHPVGMGEVDVTINPGDVLPIGG